MPTRVLITGAGGSAAMAFMDAFSSDEVTFIAVDVDPDAAGLYLVPGDQRAVVPRGDAADFVPRLAALCGKHAIDVLVPTVDTELLPIAHARPMFEDAGTRVALASTRTLMVCLDKANLMAACIDTGTVPHWDVCDDAFVLDSDLSLPIVVKPRSARGARGVRVLRTAAELAALPRSAELLVQEYLAGDDYSVDVFARPDGVVIASVPRILVKVASGVVVTGRTILSTRLEEAAASVARAIGLTGVASVELRLDHDGAPRLLEVNARLPATMALTVAAGVPMPQMLLESALGIRHLAERMPFREVAMVLTLQGRTARVA